MVFQRLARWLRRNDVDREIAQELRAHVQMEAEDRVRAGESPAEARRNAMLAFGGEDRYREAGRDAMGLRLWSDVESDVRYGRRSLARTPAYAWVAALTLALGIGGSVARDRRGSHAMPGGVHMRVRIVKQIFPGILTLLKPKRRQQVHQHGLAPRSPLGK
jgi:hypothetical protein